MKTKNYLNSLKMSEFWVPIAPLQKHSIWVKTRNSKYVLLSELRYIFIIIFIFTFFAFHIQFFVSVLPYYIWKCIMKLQNINKRKSKLIELYWGRDFFNAFNSLQIMYFECLTRIILYVLTAHFLNVYKLHNVFFIWNRVILLSNWVGVSQLKNIVEKKMLIISHKRAYCECKPFWV